jgi:hypothetical protein
MTSKGFNPIPTKQGFTLALEAQQSPYAIQLRVNAPGVPQFSLIATELGLFMPNSELRPGATRFVLTHRPQLQRAIRRQFKGKLQPLPRRLIP